MTLRPLDFDLSTRLARISPTNGITDSMTTRRISSPVAYVQEITINKLYAAKGHTEYYYMPLK